MSFSNRSYLCVVCGMLKRLPIPPGFTRRHIVPTLGQDFPPLIVDPVPIAWGHWGNHGLPRGLSLPAWFYHCGQPLYLLGKRASQAAGRISPQERIAWVRIGARVMEHAGKGSRRWRAVLRQADLKQAYPLV